MWAKIAPWLIPFLVATAITGYASYSSNDKQLSQRVTAIETAQDLDRDNYDARLSRLEQKVDRILELLIHRR